MDNALISADPAEAQRVRRELCRFNKLLQQAVIGLDALHAINAYLLSREVILGMWDTLRQHWREVDVQPVLNSGSVALKAAHSHLEKNMDSVRLIANSCFVSIDGGYDALQQLRVAKSSIASLVGIVEFENNISPLESWQ